MVGRSGAPPLRNDPHSGPSLRTEASSQCSVTELDTAPLELPCPEVVL